MSNDQLATTSAGGVARIRAARSAGSLANAASGNHELGTDRLEQSGNFLTSDPHERCDEQGIRRTRFHGLDVRLGDLAGREGGCGSRPDRMCGALRPDGSRRAHWRGCVRIPPALRLVESRIPAGNPTGSHVDAASPWIPPRCLSYMSGPN